MRNIYFSLLIISFGISNDIGITKVIEPSGFIQPASYNPRAQIKNFEEGDESLWVFFNITSLVGDPVYFDSCFVNISSNQVKTVTFNNWMATTGIYISKCSLDLYSDPNSGNNILSAKVRVEVLVLNQWILRDSVPIGLNRKKVKDGAGLIDGANLDEYFIYAVKGNNTNEFYRYDLVFGTWQEKSAIPVSAENPKKLAKKGTCMARVGDYLYLAKGNNTREFWAYCIASDSWERKQDIPGGARGKGLKGGSSIARGKINNKKYLYLIRGSGTREFYTYDTDLDTWIEKTSTPYVGTKETKIKKGSCLFSNGDDIYLLKNKTNELFFYDCDLDVWYPRKTLPFYGVAAKKTKVKDGTAAIFINNNYGLIYTLKGGCNEFWCYSVKHDSWLELNPLPLSPSNKKVKGGGSLLSIAGRILALKGNKTNELWIYMPTDTLFDEEPSRPTTNIQQNNFIKLSFNKLPDLTCKDLTIYDANGRKLNISGLQDGIRRRLNPGVYFISYINNKKNNFRKIIVIR